jgi:hypothetical protein
MLSTKLGYLRPAFFADRLAAAFAESDSFVDIPVFFFGLAFFQGALGAANSHLQILRF